MKIVIDGNIGAGKTTQLGLLESKGWFVKREAIEKWPLKEFYEDPGRWTFLLHMRILQTFRPVQTTQHVVYERSPWSSRSVFWPQFQVSSIEDETYKYFFEREKWFPDIYIYLSKDPEIAYQHIQKRHQTGDESITISYLKELDIEYNKLAETIPCTTYILDANRSEEEIHQEICQILSENELFVSDAFRI